MRVAGRAAEIGDAKMGSNTEGLAAWLLARIGAWRGKNAVRRSQMRLLETLPLGGRRQLMLVACAGERFLVGGGPDRVETIVRLRDVRPGGQSQDEPCL